MTIVSTPSAVEADHQAGDLRLGDVITRVPGTDIPVRWELLSDPVTCSRGHVTVRVALEPPYESPRQLVFWATDELRAEVCPSANRGRYRRPTTESEAS